MALNNQATSSPPIVQAVSTAGFIGGIGIATHVNLANVIPEMKYLGINQVRTGFAVALSEGPTLTSQIAAEMAAGIQFDLVTDPGTPASQYVAGLDQLQAMHPGGVDAIEGYNETPVANLDATQAFQAKLYAAVRADPKLAGVAVYNYTIFSEDASTFFLEGNVSSTATDGNTHSYSTEFPPNLWNSWFVPLGLSGTPNDPYVVTETGYPTDPTVINGIFQGVNADVAAKYTLDNIFDLIKDGASRLYINELSDENYDPNYANGENHFGLFNYDGTPKEGAVALHNLTTILADPGATASSFTPGTLSYSVSGLNSTINPAALEADFSYGIFYLAITGAPQYGIPALPVYGNSMLMAKSNGSFDLALWQEPEIWDGTTSQEINVAPTPVTVNLGQIAGSVEVFDPLVGTSPIATYINASQITVNLTDHPVIVEIDPLPPVVTPTPIPPPAPGPTILGSGVDTIALQVAEQAYQGDAQFTVSVDGVQVGGTQTATASKASGVSQVFDVEGSFGAGTHAVTVNFLNDLYGGSAAADRNLYVTGASFNNVAATNGTLSLMAGGPQTLTVGRPVPAPTVVGSGADTIALQVAEDAYQGDAQFSVSVDGVQIGATQPGQQVGAIETATALQTDGTSQIFDIEGNFGAGTHTVTVNFLNDLYAGSPTADRNLYVNGATYDGVPATNGKLTILGGPPQSLTVGTPVQTLPPAGNTIMTGSGDVVRVGTTPDTVNAAGTSATVIGGTAALTFIGGSGSDNIYAGSGMVTITANGDVLNFLASKGVATINAGTGPENYNFVNGTAGGTLTVSNYNPALDHIQLFDYAPGAATQTLVNGSTQIVLSDNTKITLLGTSLSQPQSYFITN